MWQSPPFKSSQPYADTCHNPPLTKLTSQILPRHHLLHLTHETLTLAATMTSRRRQSCCQTSTAAAAASGHHSSTIFLLTGEVTNLHHLLSSSQRRHLRPHVNVASHRSTIILPAPDLAGATPIQKQIYVSHGDHPSRLHCSSAHHLNQARTTAPAPAPFPQPSRTIKFTFHHHHFPSPRSCVAHPIS